MDDMRILTLLVFVTVAVVQDICRMRIKNELIIAGMGLGMIFRFGGDGISSVVPVLGNILFPVLLLFLIFRIGAIGAGDIKLFSMIGCYIRFQELAWCIIYAFLIGAIISLGLLLINRNLRQSLVRIWQYVVRLQNGQRINYRQMGVEKQNLMHFSIAIALGLVVVLVKGCTGL